MKLLLGKKYLVVILTLVSFSLFAQKQNNPVQNFQSPFKSKADIKNSNQNKNAGNEGDLKIETVKGSFAVSVEKYNLTKEQIESNIKNYLSLSENHSFKKIKESTDDLGFTHITYQQLFNNISVDGSIVMLHLKNGKPNSLNGQIAEIKNLETSTAISSAKALETAKQFTKVTELINSYPVELLIAQIPSENGFVQRLAYKVRIDGSKPFTMCNVFVDAITGQVVNKISLITDADVTANANTLYSGTQSITTDSYAGGYRLRDNARKIETYDATNASLGPVYTGYSDYSNTSTTWSGVARLNSFTITSVAQSWWYTALADELPDLYIVVKNALNQIVYTSGYYNNTNPSVTFNNLNIVLTNAPYTVEVWDYDAVGGNDFGGSYTISTTTGTQSWSGNGNSGSYVIGSSNNPALDVHWGMQKTYDFYKNIFNRNSYDGLGSTIKNFINPPELQPGSYYGTNNAFANASNVMCYGLGDGTQMKPVVSLDVEGHEFSHMVVATNGLGGLNYQSESGALNESFADIFGTCIEFYTKPSTANWTIGEDLYLVAPFYFRSMSNPNNASNPDTYNGTYWANTSSTQDQGGVHTNSGVQNFWFYLLCEGGSGTNDLGNAYAVGGIGITQARQIAYRNLTTYLNPNATYYQAYLGSLQATEDLYGNPSTQYTAVKNAWYAVGIGGTPTNYCSGTTRLNATSGSVSDGSGSANYLNNASCKWVIAPPGANQINLNFTSLSTELNYDTVFIHNGPDATYPYTWWTGNFTTLPTYTSTGGAVTIRFVSDNTNTAAGWSLNYTSTGTTPSCSGSNVLANPTGTFTDGSGTANYGNNQFCYWLIAPPCATSVTLSLTQLNTEAGYDGVIVYNGNNTNAPVLGSYSGTTLPSSITANGGQMLVVFVSDFSTTGQGFSANYTSTGAAYCSGTTTLNTADYGTITDGSGTNNYCNNQNCSWLIQPPQATSVTLNFSAFDIEAASTDGNSIYDAVEIYNGTTTSAPLLGRFSGSTIPPAITASSGSMLVRFFSDVSVTKAGWSANYTSTSPSYCNTATTLTAASGSFTDGSGTNQYANNTNCSWLIQPSGAASITLSFSSFATEANYDGIIVHNGSSASAPILGQFTGATIPPSVTSTTGSMFVRFLSDVSQRGSGWVANYVSTTSSGGGGAGGGTGGGSTGGGGTGGTWPLQLLSFTAQKQSVSVLTQWRTSAEVNTSHFNVQRSIDGLNFGSIGKVVAIGNSNSTQSYQFLDSLLPTVSKAYYRLQMVDKDASFTLSPVVEISFTGKPIGLNVFPNPVRDNLYAQVTNDKVENATIQIIDMQGRVLQEQIIQIMVGTTSLTINTNKLASGSYILAIKGRSGLQKQFIRE